LNDHTNLQGELMIESKFLVYEEEISDSFLKTVSAFSNYGKGQIIFGKKDNGKIIGFINPGKVCLDIENKINYSIEPKVDFHMEINTETNVITLTVIEGQHKPYFYNSRAYKRNDTRSVEIGNYELRRLILEQEDKTFENLPSKNQDLSFKYLESHLKSHIAIKELTQDILIALDLFDKEEGFNKAAELLADKNSFFGIDMVRFGESINIFLDRETFSGISILEQFDKALVMYRRYYQYEEIKGLQRVKVEKIPEEAFKMAIANALIHRAWDINSHIRVVMYDDLIDIAYLGGLPKGMTKVDYLEGKKSIARNPIIGNIFFRLNHIKRFGTGIKRINQAYSQSQVKPIFKVTGNSINILLPVMKE